VFTVGKSQETNDGRAIIVFPYAAQQNRSGKWDFAGFY
jgi:hypothetical protein